MAGVLGPAVRCVESLAAIRHATAIQQSFDTSLNGHQQRAEVVVVSFMGTERHAAAPVGREHPVHHQRVNVHVQVQRRAKALDDSDGTAAAIGYSPPPRLSTQPAEHGAQLDRDHVPAERVVPCQQVPKTRRHGQDPLADRYGGKHVVDQVGRPVGHASSTTTRAESAAFA